MKKVKCSGCMQVLGVPAKFFGKKVTCPNCNLRLMISIDTPSEPSEDLENETVAGAVVQEDPDPLSSATLPAASPPNFGKITTLRAIPRPPALSQESDQDAAVAVPDSPQPTTQTAPSPQPDDTGARQLADDERIESVVSRPKTIAKSGDKRKKKRKKNESTARSRRSPDEASTADAMPDTEALSKPVPNQPVTARIIQATEVKPYFNEEGELPTLRLKDDKKAAPQKKEKGTSPVLLGVLVCGSLILSGLILVFGDFKPKADEHAMQQARERLTKFYTVRIDIPLKPYQILLREAQLAHSRGDREAEVRALREVMSRFRVEDRNKFVGVTGSPTADAELEKLVSILLGTGQPNGKGLFR